MLSTEREFLARCTECGQPVHEDHSHVMVVPVGRGRMFFHAGCWHDNALHDPVNDGPNAERDASSG
jgi:hypothetical protein